MEKLIVLTFPLLIALSACAQEIPQNLVPSVVINAFQQKFPNATDIEWEKEGELYEVEFDRGNREHKALFDATGKMKKHKEEIAAGSLPDAVKKTITAGFEKYQVEEAKRIETEGLVIYKVELENGSEEKKIYLGEDGKVIEPKISYE